MSERYLKARILSECVLDMLTWLFHTILLLVQNSLLLESLFWMWATVKQPKKLLKGYFSTTVFVTLHWIKCSKVNPTCSPGLPHTDSRIVWAEDEHGAEREDGARAALVQILQILLSHGHCLAVYTVHWEDKQMSLLLEQHWFLVLTPLKEWHINVSIKWVKN